MKIAIINRHRNDSLGGSELQCDLIATALHEKGHDVVYIALDGKPGTYDTPYEVVPCQADGNAISKTVVNQHADLVYWRFNKVSFYSAVRVIKEHGIPVIFAASHINDLRPWSVKPGHRLKTRIKTLLKNRWNHRGFKYIDALTVNNRTYLGKLGIPVERYIPNGVVSEAIPFEWGRPFVAWVANLKDSKRPELFLKLAEHFQSTELDFLMAGSIQLSQYDWVGDDSSTPGNFYFLGPKSVEEVNGILAASRFHVHTCEPEGFPNVFLQAWAQGKPSVSFGFDPGEHITSNRLGFVSGDDWDKFTEQVQTLIEDADLRNSMGERARQVVKENFSTKQSIRKLEDLMIEITNRTGG